MTTVLDQVALVIAAGGVVVAGVALASSRSWRAAIGVLAELLVAAGLVRLSAEPDWDRLATATSILAVRRLVLTTLLQSPPIRRDRSAGASFPP